MGIFESGNFEWFQMVYQMGSQALPDTGTIFNYIDEMKLHVIYIN